MNAVWLNILGISIVCLPVVVLLLFGPEPNKRHLSYGIVGLVVAGIIGVILYFFAADARFNFPTPWHSRLARDVTAAVVEELVRYPGILFAEFFTLTYILKEKSTPTVEDAEPSLMSRFITGEFTKITDPHGMGLYFGVGYGMGEAIVFYIVPTIIEIIQGEAEFNVGPEVLQIALRVTAVMAHVGLTYLAMAITTNRGYWRVTVLLHLSANTINRIFQEFAPNDASTIVFGMFTRFAIVVIAYYLLLPRIRYLSPAVLVLILVTLFLLAILLSTILALLIGLFSSQIFGPL
ncbi:MAG: hypothetical protein ACXAE3_13775 [Candidatus Kariarchaeaceae archaeon]